MRRCSLTICAIQDFPIWAMVPKIYQELYFCWIIILLVFAFVIVFVFVLFLGCSAPGRGTRRPVLFISETPSNPPLGINVSCYRYLKVSPALCPSLSLIHWYLKCQGWATSSCPHSIVLLLVHCPQPIQIIIGIAPVRGEKAKRSKFSGFLLLKSNSWHYTLNMCSFDIKQTDESKTCWMLEIK